jgi:hypothetical protein
MNSAVEMPHFLLASIIATTPQALLHWRNYA